MKFFILLLLTLNLYAINSFEFYEDITNSLKIEDILKLKDKFILQKSNKINFKLTKSTFWMKLNIENSDNISKNRILQITPPILEHIDLYDIDNNRVYKNGSNVAIKNRDIKDYNILFNISLKPKETKEIFLRLESKTSKLILFNLYEDIQEYRYKTMIENSFNAFLIGILILAIIYNFFIYLYTKDKVFIFYVLFIASQTLFLLYYTSFILNFIDSQNFVIVFTLSQFFIMIFMILLIKEFFKTKKDFKIFNTIFNIFIFISLIVSISLFFDIILANKIKNQLLVLLFNIMILIFFIKILIVKRNSITTLFIFGWLVYSLSGFYLILLTNGVIKAHFLSVYSFKFGILFEAILFSILLSYKFYILKYEKIKALQENTQKEKMLIQQSKMAQMGEMIGNIVHQWRQPLNALSLIIQKLETDYFFNEKIDEKYINEIVEDSLNQIMFMSKTMDDFKDFFSPNKLKQSFSIQKAIEEVLTIISSQIKSKNITLLSEYNDFNIDGYKNEFKQVILNILNNAKEELIFKNIKEPQIKIRVYKENSRGTITIEDNAGGIKKEIVDKIFEPYFSTKDEIGTGIGLHMSKIIIVEHLEGELKVSNTQDGAKFIINFNI